MGEEDKRKRRKKKWVATQSQVRGAKRGEAVHKGPTDAANPVRLAAMVDYRTMRVLLLNLSSETKNLAGSGLAGQGYAIAIARGAGHRGFADGFELLRDDHAIEGAVRYARVREDSNGGARGRSGTSA